MERRSYRGGLPRYNKSYGDLVGQRCKSGRVKLDGENARRFFETQIGLKGYESMLQNALSKATLYRRLASRQLPIRAAFCSLRSSTVRSLKNYSPRSLPYKQPRRNFQSESKQSLDFGEDTIYALSTAPGRAGIAIVRISGPSCLHVSFLPPRF